MHASSCCIPSQFFILKGYSHSLLAMVTPELRYLTVDQEEYMITSSDRVSQIDHLTQTVPKAMLTTLLMIFVKVRLLLFVSVASHCMFMFK